MNVPPSQTQELPTSPDDPRLEGWYHTIDFGNGLVSKGVYDHRSIVDRYGLPKSLEGQTALDIGTAEGFWAFELERRGASRVVATDVESREDIDLLPWIDRPLADYVAPWRFWMAHALRHSKVERQVRSVYDLSPETVGSFDLVFCGHVVLHLQNPLGALVQIRSVTKGMAIVATLLEKEIDEQAPKRPWVSFGHREHEKQLGEACLYWRFSTQALQEMMEYAGFVRTEVLEPFRLPPPNTWQTVIIGHADGG